jgi:hypothetical protein
VVATIDDVRRLALALPQAEEKPSFNGTAGFRAGGGRLFAREREDGESIALRVDPGERDLLLASEPDVFYITDHYRNYPYVVVRLANVELDELEELLTDAWRSIAPKRLVARFDAEHPPA